MPVRAHGSHPYLDATRGAVAVARGPLVYCVEQQDCPGPVDDLVLPAVNANIAASDRRQSPDVGRARSSSRWTAAAAPPPSAELYPELPAEQAFPATTVTATFVPYFLWGNRRPAGHARVGPEYVTPTQWIHSKEGDMRRSAALSRRRGERLLALAACGGGGAAPSTATGSGLVRERPPPVAPCTSWQSGLLPPGSGPRLGRRRQQLLPAHLPGPDHVRRGPRQRRARRSCPTSPPTPASRPTAPRPGPSPSRTASSSRTARRSPARR